MTQTKLIGLVVFYLVSTFFMTGCKLAILNPQGLIAASEEKIIILSALLMLIVVVPVIILTLLFAWRYRAGNSQAVYAPDWSHHALLEIIWWTVPCIIIAILGVMTWKSSHQLDPYKPMTSTVQPMTIQAIALEWKWLFIYPEQHIATINFLQLPVGVPVTLLITAEGPMNSLQIPQLAGQIYAMAGMQTQLHLVADTVGDYSGFSANFSGQGFSGMTFKVRVGTRPQFQQWVHAVKQSSRVLTLAYYNRLVQPSDNVAVHYFSSSDARIFATAMMKYQMSMSGQEGH